MSNEIEAAGRVEAFLNRRLQMRGIDQEVIHGVGDENGYALDLNASDLRLLIEATKRAQRVPMTDANPATTEKPAPLTLREADEADALDSFDIDGMGD